MTLIFHHECDICGKLVLIPQSNEDAFPLVQVKKTLKGGTEIEMEFCDECDKSFIAWATERDGLNKK